MLPTNISEPASKRIFELRKSGNLEGAFGLLLDNLPVNYPSNKLSLLSDKWLTIAAYNVLIDLIKIETSKESKDNDRIDQLKFLLSGIDVSSDPLKYSYLNRILSSSNQYYYLIEQYKKIPKKEDNLSAINLLKEYKYKSQDFSFDSDLAWRIYFYITENLAKDRFNTHDLKLAFNDYFHLNLSDKTKIHPLILIAAKQFKKKLEDKNWGNEFRFYSFVRIWDLVNLTEADWKQNNPKFKSLAEDVITLAAKELSNSNNVSNDFIEYYLPYINELISRGTDNIWIHLYYSRLLCKLNKIAEAKESLTKVIKEKKTESWAWNELGLLSETSDYKLALSCFCKALICGGPEEFKVNIHKNLGLLLEKSNELAHAKTEYLRYYEIKGSEKGLDRPDWFEQIEAVKDHKYFYQQNSDLAEEVLFENLQTINGVVGRETIYFDRNKNKDVKKTILYAQVKGKFSFTNISAETIPQELKVSKNLLPYDVKAGSPILIKGETNGNGLNILRIENDSNIKEFEIPQLIGVITTVNNKDGFVIVTLDKDCSVRIDIKLLKKSDCFVGQGLKLEVAYRYNKESKPVFTAVEVIGSVPPDNIPSYLLKSVQGTIDIRSPNSFGFIEGIFVPESVISNSNVKDQDYVTGTAIISFNKKKNMWGYSVVRIEKC
ncbi:MAG: hypothetical protein SPK70_10480 [Succinivibrio dextrinosolvens]|nr:hypothetical protein [Succinivibrio dextrinosolvens]MDY6471482.1 hypothetical protein [Succinivibrio dextrinosolvens]